MAVVTPAEQPTASAAAAVQPTVAPTEATSSPGTVASTNEATNLNPLCPDEQDYSILPAGALRLFYRYSSQRIAIPQRYASCFGKRNDMNFIFFEYNGARSFPWLPLVQMQGDIEESMVVPSLKDIRKQFLNETTDEERRAEINKYFDSTEKAFAGLLTEKWVILKIHKDRIEDAPSYWPKTPNVHARAKFINAETFRAMRDSGDAILVDVRPPSERDERPFPFQSVKAGIGVSGFHRNILELSKIDDASKLKVDKSAPVVLIGRDEYDHGPYNLASNLALNGYTNISIVAGGIAAVIKSFPSMTLPQPVGKRISPDDLKNKMKSEKDTVLLVDCRNPKVAHGLIPGSVRINSKEEQGSEDGDFYVAEVKKELAARPQVKSIVLIGSNSLDPKPAKVAGMLNSSLPLYELTGGFQAWGFQNRFVWPDKAQIKKIPSHLRFAHARPEEIKRELPASMPAKVVVKPKAPEVMPPSMGSKKRESGN